MVEWIVLPTLKRHLFRISTKVYRKSQAFQALVYLHSCKRLITMNDVQVSLAILGFLLLLLGGPVLLTP